MSQSVQVSQYSGCGGLHFVNVAAAAAGVVVAVVIDSVAANVVAVTWPSLLLLLFPQAMQVALWSPNLRAMQVAPPDGQNWNEYK